MSARLLGIILLVASAVMGVGFLLLPVVSSGNAVTSVTLQGNFILWQPGRPATPLNVLYWSVPISAAIGASIGLLTLIRESSRRVAGVIVSVVGVVILITLIYHYIATAGLNTADFAVRFGGGYWLSAVGAIVFLISGFAILKLSSDKE